MPMYKFRLVGAEHVDSAGKTHATGSIILSTTPLHKLFQNKFMLLSREKRKAAPEPEEDADDDEEMPDDVTESFPTAKENIEDVAVYQDGKRYYVFDRDTINDIPFSQWQPVNPKPLKKREVEPFLDEYVERIGE